jgi:hypothetical protein
LLKLAKDHEVPLQAVYSGLVTKGKDLGSTSYKILKLPQIGLIIGNSVSPTAAGEVWYLLENKYKTQFTLLDINWLGKINLNNYQVLILTDGEYENMNPNLVDNLIAWTKNGGRLILIQRATDLVSNKPGISFKTFQTEEEKKKLEQKALDLKKLAMHRCYGEEERNKISSEISGAILKTQIDSSHFLGYGYTSTYFTLKQSGKYVPLMIDAYNVAKTYQKPVVAGYVGKNAATNIENSLVIGHQKMEQGSIVYMIDDPLFRLFWQGGRQLFVNALLFGY